jgi:hypothetical protein
MSVEAAVVAGMFGTRRIAVLAFRGEAIAVFEGGRLDYGIATDLCLDLIELGTPQER